MGATRKANTLIEHDSEKVWTGLIDVLGLRTGYLILPKEYPSSRKSPDSLGPNMRLTSTSRSGYNTAAIMTAYNVTNKTLNIRLLSNESYNSSPVRDYLFSVHPTQFNEQSNIEFTLISHIANESDNLAENMLSEIVGEIKRRL